MKNLIVVLVVALLALSACTQADKTAVENKALAQRFFEEVWNQGNLDVIDEMVAAEFVRHNPSSWEPSVIEGSEAFKEYVANIRTTYPDFSVEVQNRIAEGDMVAASWTATGTDKDSNKQFSVTGMSMTRYADGKAVEEWMTFDTHTLMQQLGMVPEAETTMK
jgi:steroid delta-isomerase-like uncharacterized protein